MIVEKEITTKTAAISITKEGFLKIRFLDNDLEMDLEEVQAQIRVAEQLTGGKDMFVFIDARDSMHDLTQEAKEFIVNYPNKKAEAILIKELHQRIIATFYLKLSVSLHRHPVKIFKSEEEAIQWLVDLKKNN